MRNKLLQSGENDNSPAHGPYLDVIVIIYCTLTSSQSVRNHAQNFESELFECAK